MPALQAKGRDDLVMATNNSSIVSKRSVERIYYSGEREYYRYFVKKYQRRAPLINRGYHLRLHLIDVMTMFRYPEHCEGVKFVDIDFPDVIIAKRNIVKQSVELQEPLTNLEFLEHPRVLLKSDQYFQIACDLRQSSVIGKDLSTLVDTASSEFLFVAEVSITYMEFASADAIIHWASTIGDAEFCLLEQILPGGPAVPFAQTMMQHFDRLGTSLKCIHDYPTIDSQKKRFHSLGWLETRCWSLWQAWKDPYFLCAADRCQLDKVEVFDEWEEFAHFASHYFILHASNLAPDRSSGDEVSAKNTGTPVSDVSLSFSPVGQHKNTGLRRFGVPLIVKDALGDPCLANLFGIGTDCRLPSYDVYSARGEQTTIEDDLLRGGGPTARTFSTLTDIGDAGYLLTGGRASPASPFRDSWIIKKDTYRWQKSHDLPLPLFRHAVTRLHNAQLALLAGGKSSASALFPGYLLYHPANGWTECKVVSSLRPPALFGAVLFCSGRVRENSSAFYGTLAGGMTADNIVYDQAVRWVIDVSQVKTCWLRIYFADLGLRAGASMDYVKTSSIVNDKSSIAAGPKAQTKPTETTPIPRLKLESKDHFASILQAGKPFVFEGLSIGSCTAKWDTDYLAKHVGPGRNVVVHEASSPTMDFVSKNFRYTTREFGDFIRDVGMGKQLYLRALSANQPSDVPARLYMDYPSLSDDFVLPPELEFARERVHSSVLRISGSVNMWLHYDVLANVYCQVQGSKRFYLFPPSDVMQLGFGPGASSSSIDVFSSIATGSLTDCHPYEAIVGPGDVLFIPQLWLHTASPLSTSSVAVNVFFRDLEAGYSLGRDVYANRDLAAYEKARQDISKISKMFRGLPLETKEFYVRRIADELMRKVLE
ncbi:leucine carboxyl methyltransferase [Grosmannia clavigera kw1407]|uniref:tRNA wybutosine-synthesizing protein 4 n=1 Tax=Grosmannia clavigera (strain kw1407 / UAMH 11150) TaxID=655863 RepID=F0XTD6_GROCL|nr:leucine carboxyl methyltransferase [Grosmannia clavigera kw1407]EFW98978.1 leucine carboxyl methyltransferase [Grosmannia clavigera kw1407]